MAGHNLPKELLAQISTLIADRIGLSYPPERWGDLEHGLACASPDFGLTELEAFARWLVSPSLQKGHIERLASYLTIGETYFFRERKSLEIVERAILPQLIEARRGRQQRLRIWSAGCATGEEAYSLAILLHSMLPDIQDWDITILASDINQRFLDKARQGRYTQWSFRSTEKHIRERYFRPLDDGYFEILPHLREMVTCFPLNLVDDAYPSMFNGTQAIDLLFCRNVLMYFDQRQARRVIARFYDALNHGGWLIVSAVETSQLLFAQFTTVNFPEAILYCKGEINDQLKHYLRPADQPAQLARRRQTGPLPASPTATTTPAEVKRTTLPAGPPGSGAPRASHARYSGQTMNPKGEPAPETQRFPDAARRYGNAEQLHAALAECRQALARDQHNPHWHYLLATILQEQGALAEAVATLQRALTLDPMHILAHVALGRLLSLQGKRGEAEQHFERARDLLRSYPQDAALPDADGLTAGTLISMLTSPG